MSLCIGRSRSKLIIMELKLKLEAKADDQHDHRRRRCRRCWCQRLKRIKIYLIESSDQEIDLAVCSAASRVRPNLK